MSVIGVRHRGAVSDTNLLPTYPETKIGFVEGDGVWLTGIDGRRYLDFAAGIAVVSLGHRHPAPLHLLGDLRAGAVHDTDGVAERA